MDNLEENWWTIREETGGQFRKIRGRFGENISERFKRKPGKRYMDIKTIKIFNLELKRDKEIPGVFWEYGTAASR